MPKQTPPKPSDPPAFMDLNIPHSTKQKTRTKLITKAMELGYTGVAYNHTIKGTAMSNTDVCTITPIPLSSVLQLSPNISTKVKFHRELLNIPMNTPFKQFTRLTVAVDSAIQAAALNSGNPVLKSYDLVAVRPLNQDIFDRACKVSEVDLIAIDFTEKVPFRMDFQTVKTAIKRGIYFEITYSHLVSDVHTRRHVISNSKLLVEWTRGRNLIFSSAAASVSELRGPHDVSNLTSILGLSMKQAQAAISKNCRLLLLSALRKKQYYKKAIKVERISFDKPLDSKESWFCDEKDGDHISNAEGDLLLDDTASFSATASNGCKASVAIDFASIAEEMPSNRFSLKDWLPPNKVPKTTKAIVFTSAVKMPSNSL